MFYYLKKFWKQNALAGLFTVLRYGLQIYQSIFTMYVFSAIISADWREFFFWLSVSTGAYLASYCLNCAYECLRAKAIRLMNNQLRRDLTASLLAKNHQEFHSQNSGTYLSWYTSNIKQIEKLAWTPFFDCISYVAMFVWGLIALSSLHWSLVLVALLSSLIGLAGPRLWSEKLKAQSEQSVCAQASATGKFKDALLGFDLLCGFGQSAGLVKRIAEASEEVEAPECRRTCSQSVFNSLLSSVYMLCGVSTSVLTAYLSINGTIVATALGGVGSLKTWVTQGLVQLIDVSLSFTAAKPYFEPITVHAEKAVPAAPAEKQLEGSIILDHVNFSYGDKPVLRDTSLAFEKGKKYALTGPSGCGKSTVLKLLLGWLPNYTGQILLDGRDAKDYTPEQLQSSMSYIEQDVFLFNSTIRDNITLGERFTDEEMKKALHDSALEGDLVNMPQGLDTPVGEDGSCLSGGQKQRVAIARALLHNRSVLLVDEGTSALDQENADIVEKSLLNNPDLTLILVSHHLSEERKAQFDRVYTLDAAVPITV